MFVALKTGRASFTNAAAAMLSSSLFGEFV